MGNSSFIKRHIFLIPLDKIFTSRDLLVYGSRNNVDQTTHKYVKAGAIVRLARGVFVKPGPEFGKISVVDVAKAKAEAFGKQVSTWGGNLASKLGLGVVHAQAYTYYVNASSSSFWCGSAIVRFKKACSRKTRLGSGSQAGTFLGALWYLGESQLPTIQREYRWLPSKLNRIDKAEVRMSFKWIPEWLSSCFLDWPIPPSALHT